MQQPPSLSGDIGYLAIGNPTIDEDVQCRSVLGGTAVYSALQAALLGWDAHILGRGRAAELAGLQDAVVPPVDLVLQAANETTRFVNVTIEGERQQWVNAWAGEVALNDHEARPRVLHVAPVAREVDPDVATRTAASALVGITPQGLVRRWGPDRRVVLRPLEVAPEVARRFDVVVASEVEERYLGGLMGEVRRNGGLVVVTRGPRGCVLRGRHLAQWAAAVPARGVVDDTGAGDVFAGALFVRLAEGADVLAAARFAMAAATCSIEAIGVTGVSPRHVIEQRAASAPQDSGPVR